MQRHVATAVFAALRLQFAAAPFAFIVIVACSIGSGAITALLGWLVQHLVDELARGGGIDADRAHRPRHRTEHDTEKQRAAMGQLDRACEISVVPAWRAKRVEVWGMTTLEQGRCHATRDRCSGEQCQWLRPRSSRWSSRVV